jgi:hypothetical protein
MAKWVIPKWGRTTGLVNATTGNYRYRYLAATHTENDPKSVLLPVAAINVPVPEIVIFQFVFTLVKGIVSRKFAMLSLVPLES